MTDVPEDDSDMDDDDGCVAENCVSLQELAPVTIPKFHFVKNYRESNLKRIPYPLAEHIQYSCFSEKSKNYYEALLGKCKRTYVGASLNPYLGNALFAGEDLSPGEFITVYHGKRYSYAEIDAMQKGGRCSEYAMYVTKGVVIDALGFPTGAGMANHSCRPNARLRHGYLPGIEHAPFGYLQAIRHIKAGTEIEGDYGYVTKYDK